MSPDTTGADTRTDTLIDPRVDVVATMRAAEAQSGAWLASIDTSTETGMATYLLAVRVHAGIVNVLSLASDDEAIARAITEAGDWKLAGGRYCFSGICGECEGCTRLGWPFSTWILKVDATRAVVEAVLDEEHITPIRVTHTGQSGIEVTGGYVSMNKCRDVLVARGYATTLISKPRS